MDSGALGKRTNNDLVFLFIWDKLIYTSQDFLISVEKADDPHVIQTVLDSLPQN